MFEVIVSSEYQVSKWSGGLTKQIYIMPKDANYADRNFTVRISSATVDLPESDFTYLPGVYRYLTSLTGKMNLTINHKENVTVLPQKIVEFSGEDEIHCVGCATDMNLMLKGAEGKMYTAPTGKFELKREKIYFFYGEQEMTFAGIDNSLEPECYYLEKGDCMHVFDEHRTVTIQSNLEQILVIEVNASCDK